VKEVKVTPWREGMTPEAGKIYSGMPNESYHGFREWNGSSMLKHALRSVESFLYEKEQEPKSTLALERGGAFHLCLEGLTQGKGMEFYQDNVLPCPTKTILTKSWYAEKEANSGCYCLPEAERDAVATMSLNIHAKGSRLKLFDSGFAELSFFWIDEKTGIKCKARTDWIDFGEQSGNQFILDYKSTKNHKRKGFDREMLNYGYHFSAAFYMEGVRQVTGLPFDDFTVAACANTPPHEVRFYPVGRDSLDEGRSLFQDCLWKIANHEPDEEPIIEEPLDIPRYGMTIENPFEE